MCPKGNFNPAERRPPFGKDAVVDANIERARKKVREKMAEKGVVLGVIEGTSFIIEECPRLNFVSGSGTRTEVKIVVVDVAGRCTVEVVKNGNQKDFGYLILLPKLEIIKE
jgi:hypothetical protein